MRQVWVKVVPLLAALVVMCGGTTVEAQTTQKQWQLVKSGKPGYTLKLADAPVRKPAAGEVLIKIHAASLNRRDVYVMHGQYPMPPRDVVVPLSDGAGEVVAVGTHAKRFKVGDRVTPIFFPRWIDGRPAAKDIEVSLGGAVDGVLTEYLTIDEQSVVAIPAGLSYEEAATLPCAAVTAWNGLVTRGHMQPGDHVLLEGTGGVSIFGLQFAVASGAKPIITSSSDDKLGKAKALGAIGGVNYKTSPDWEKPVRALTNGVGAQLALDVGGKDTLPHALASLSPGAHLALIGGLGGFGGDVPVMALLSTSTTVSGIYVGSRANFEAMNAFIVKHAIKPVIDKTFAFKDAPAAYELMENGSFFGKIVIRL
jgi:NADPH:quinone reductase-like Zn-dependent oxidoreductase